MITLAANVTYAIPSADYITILPELVLAAFGVVVMMAEPFFGKGASRKPLGWVAVVGAVAALAATWYQAGSPYLHGFFDMVVVDHFSIFFHVTVAFVLLVALLGSLDYVEREQLRAGEFYALMLFGAVGMDLMSSADELVLIFVALEISSISTYILAGMRRRVATSAEASLKYFLLGSFATAFFLYGISLMFGATGTTNILRIGPLLHGGSFSPLVFAAVALMLVGLGFKVAAVPFHVWTPDVYEGAPAPVVAFMSTAPKAAAFAVLLRVLFAAWTPGWFWPVWVFAALSMTLGNLGALRQSNIKRMLAYSSIAHAGYLLVAFAASNGAGISSAIFYTAAYAVMNVGAFLVISHLAGTGERFVAIDDYAGLSRRQPVIAATLAILLLSLIGIPGTGGFFAKFYVFSAALGANLVALTVLGLINSGIAAYYYLRVIVVMYMREHPAEHEHGHARERISIPEGVALTLSILATVYLGILPNRVLQLAIESAKDLLR
jgi:NADH-quinone oxidoreductase subunit N